jgi:hypothetical protein
VDEAILGAYLSGANSRRIRKVLEPLLGSEALSKSTVLPRRGVSGGRRELRRACVDGRA